MMRSPHRINKLSCECERRGCLLDSGRVNKLHGLVQYLDPLLEPINIVVANARAQARTELLDAGDKRVLRLQIKELTQLLPTTYKL